MIKHGLLTCFLIAASFHAFSQSGLSNDGRWEIGVDFLPFIGTSYTIKNSILIRQVIGDKSKLRYHIGISFQEIKSRERTLLSDADIVSNKPFQAYFSLGYEKYLQIGRVSIFAGGDMFGTYYRTLTQADLYTSVSGGPPTKYKIDDLEHEYKLGLNLLTGINVRLMSHLYLSTEAFLQTAYRWQKSDYHQYERENLQLTFSGGRIIKRLIVNLQPVSCIYLFYQF